MNCREFEAVVIELARDLRPEARAQALLHAEGCADCAVRLAQERALLVGMRLVVEDLAAQEAPAYLEANLLAAFQEHNVRRPTASLPVVATRWWSWRFATVAAAALLLVALLVTWGRVGRKEQKQEEQNLPVQADIPAPPSLLLKGSGLAANVPPQTRATTRRVPPRRNVRPAPVAPSEEPLPFYSLVEEGQMAPLESGRIVRIEVPPASLVKLGVPLTETTLTQPMQADLLLGQDGLARAIRFVPASQNARTQ